MGNAPITIFFSSSSANLEEERDCLKDFEDRWNNHKHPDKPIKIIKWENGNHFRTTGVSFQTGINPDIEKSDLIIFLFSYVLGKHTEEEYKLVVAKNKNYRILLKESNILSLHEQSMEWLKNFVLLRQFVLKIEAEGVFTGEKPIKGIEAFQWQLSNCIEQYISALETHNASEKASEFSHKGKNLDKIMLQIFQKNLVDLPEKLKELLIKNFTI